MSSLGRFVQPEKHRRRFTSTVRHLLYRGDELARAKTRSSTGGKGILAPSLSLKRVGCPPPSSAPPRSRFVGLGTLDNGVHLEILAERRRHRVTLSKTSQPLELQAPPVQRSKTPRIPCRIASNSVKDLNFSGHWRTSPKVAVPTVPRGRGFSDVPHYHCNETDPDDCPASNQSSRTTHSWQTTLPLSRRALALAVTIQVSRYSSSVFTVLAVQIWLY